MSKKKTVLFPSFAGVALADILANSVAIVIIIIVVTLMIRHEQEQEKLEQAEDVSVLLSRNIATSVVMNALPTSPPVRLHNYTTSPMDRNPQHSIMPILELHKNYVRDYYTGRRYYRNTLLLQSNPLDSYLNRLSPQQKLRMRMDIYDIRLFYIAMSILKSHKIQIGHWHFLGEPLRQAPDEDERPETEEILAADEQAPEKPGDDEENTPSARETPGDGTIGVNAVPEQSELFFPNQEGENYPFNDLALGNQSGRGDSDVVLDLPGENAAETPLREQSDAIFDALSEMMESNISRGSQRGNPSNFVSRFRSANPDEQSSLSEQDRGIQMFGQDGKPIDFYALLPALFEFMKQAQEESDRYGVSKLADYNFRRDIVGLVRQLPPLSDPRDIAFFRTVAQEVSHFPGEEKETLFLDRKTTDEIRGRMLEVPINRRIKQSVLIDDNNQTNEYELPAEKNVSVRLSLYPEIYKGLRQPFAQDSIILIPEDQENPDEFRWRVITAVNPTLSDFITAFVYSAFDEADDRLLIESETNAIKIADFQVIPNYPEVPFRYEQWQLFFYSLVAMFIIFGALQRFRKAA